MADELDKTMSHENDDAQPLDAVPVTPDAIEADEPSQQDAHTPESACEDAADASLPASDTCSVEDERPAQNDGSPEDDVPEDDAPPSTDEPAATEGEDAPLSDFKGADIPRREAESHEPATAPMPTATAKLPGTVEAPDQDEPAPDDTPQLRDVGSTLMGWLRGRAQAASAFVSTHRVLLVLISLACMLGVLAVVLFGIDASKMPPDELIKRDAQTRLVPPSYTVGPYADDNPLVLESVEIEGKHNSGSQRDACDVNVVATFTNPGMETQADALLTYTRKGDEWTCIEATVGKASHHATAGVSQQRVIEQVDTLLQEADTAEGSEPLSALYHGATVEVVGDNFNEEAQTDALILHCSSNGTFVSYECDLTVHFRFAPASGAWELVEAFVSDGARDLGFGPLLGTWTGTFTSQKSSSAKCLAARTNGLTVNVTRAQMTDDGGATIEGTLSGIAHLHADLEADADATEGDADLSEVPFTGTLSSGDVEQDVIGLLAGNNPKRSQAGIVFDCTTQDIAGGVVTLTLEFGQAKAPDAASATLTTTYSYEDTFLLVMAYQREAKFVDSFTLEKAE